MQFLFLPETSRNETVLQIRKGSRVTLGITFHRNFALLHSEWSKPYGVLTVLSAVGLICDCSNEWSQHTLLLKHKKDYLKIILNTHPYLAFW